MPRRTDEEIAASLDARAAALRQRARIKRDPLYAQAVKLRALIPENSVTGAHTASEAERIAHLQVALDAYIGDES